jgi:hypothetical protein
MSHQVGIHLPYGKYGAKCLFPKNRRKKNNEIFLTERRLGNGKFLPHKKNSAALQL